MKPHAITCLALAALNLVVFVSAQGPGPVELEGRERVACALAGEAPAAQEPATPAAKPAVPAGKVTGKLVYDGKLPEIPPLVIGADKSQGCGEHVSTQDPALLVDEHGGIANGVVTITVPGARVEIPAEPLVIDQRGCRFDPHVLVAPLGSKLRFANSDACTHNVHTYPRKSDPINKAMASGGHEELVLAQKEIVQVRCDYHPWMSCYVFVTDTPFCGVTRADGSFEIAGLAAGTYKGEVWHEQLGKLKFDVTVAADGNAKLGELKLAPKPVK